MTDDLDVVTPEEPDPVTSTDAAPADTNARNALIAFGVVLVFAFGLYVYVGRHMWFWFDEYDFLAGRGMNLHDIFEQHGGHLVALPVVIYRALYSTVGMRSYLPYQLLSITAHLVAAGLLRAVMRRAGVSPWVATLAASVFALFGTGQQDILWAFQITFVGALVFGLVQLLLADHDGPIDRRDWFGLGAGLLALLCSGVGVAMVAVVGIAALIRRGWRAALFHALPLALVYAVWEHGNEQKTQFIPLRSWTTLITWDRHNLGATFGAFAQVRYLGWAVLAMLVVGIGVVVTRRDATAWRARASLPIATFTGAILFATITGASRYWFPSAATSSRYVDITAALLLPAIAVAADALWRSSRVLAVAVAILLVIGIPGNIAATNDMVPRAPYMNAYQQMIRSLPRMRVASEVPGWVQPEPNQGGPVTVSWLLGAARSGKLPAPRPSTPVELSTNRLRLSLAQKLGSGGACRPLRGPVSVVLQRGERFSVGGTVTVRLLYAGVPSSPLTFGATFFTGTGAHVLIAVDGPLHLKVTPQTALGLASICGVPR